MRTRALHLLIALDQFLWCVVTLGRYHPDITLSAQAWIWHQRGVRSWPRRLIDTLFRPIEKDHCFNSFKAEMNRDHLMAVYDPHRSHDAL